jgi:hypothetical protein
VTERKPIYVSTNEAGQPTSLSQFEASDYIPEEHGGTGTSSIRAATGLVYDSSAGTLTTADDVNTVTFGGGAEKLIAREINVTTTLSANSNCDVTIEGTFSALSGIAVSGDLSVTGNLSGTGNIGVVGQIMCGQTGPGTADLNIVDDNSDATVEINSGANYDSKIQFRENDAWRCDMLWDGDANDFHIKTYTGDINLDPAAGYTVSASCSSITVSSCPIPNPVCVAMMGGAGTAGSTEIKFGAGVTPTTVNDGSLQITWDNANSEFDIAADGTYHVLATLVLTVATSTLPTIRIKKDTTVINHYLAHGIHSAEDPEEVTIQAAFACESGDSITVTFEDDASTNINLERGSAVTVRRLF